MTKENQTPHSKHDANELIEIISSADMSTPPTVEILDEKDQGDPAKIKRSDNY